MCEPEAKRLKPNYYMQQYRKQFVLEAGLKGFLCTCNFREKECVRESYNLLNTYYDKLQEGKKQADEDVSQELKRLQSETASEKRFQAVESGAKNVLFIRTSVEDPISITSAIIQDIMRSRQQKTKFLLRLIPIEATCKATLGEIKISAANLVNRHFTGGPKTFAVVFNQRNSDLVAKDELIKEIAAMISSRNANHKVDLRNAELTFLVEVIRSVCLLTVVPHYNKYKKYNLLQIYEAANEKR